MRSRPYETERDLRQMQALLMAARSRRDDRYYPHAGQLTWDFFMVACHLDPRDHFRLWHDAEGGLAGYAVLGEDPSFDCQVSPDHEWCGIESEALAWAAARLAELRGRDAQRWRRDLVSGSWQNDAKRRGFLEEHGFRRGEHAEVHLLRPLDEPLPSSPPPPGHRVRPVARAGETADRAAVQREVWQPWPVGMVSDDDYAYLMRLPGYRRDLDLVAVTPDGVIAAYVNGWIDPLNRIGALGPVGARPAYRRQGLARAALLECLRRMQARGVDRVCVSTGASNTPALRLYQSIGFMVAGRQLEYVKPATRERPPDNAR